MPSDPIQVKANWIGRHPYDRELKVRIMVETSVAITADIFSKYVRFLASVPADLCQYICCGSGA